MLFNGPFLRYLDQPTTREKYEELRKIYYAYKYNIDHDSTCISPFNKQKCIVNRDLANWITWVNTNIILKIGLDLELTTRVKLRIASTMLDKVDITALENMQILSNLKYNINEEFYNFINDELPF